LSIRSWTKNENARPENSNNSTSASTNSSRSQQLQCPKLPRSACEPQRRRRSLNPNRRRSNATAGSSAEPQNSQSNWPTSPQATTIRHREQAGLREGFESTNGPLLQGTSAPPEAY